MRIEIYQHPDAEDVIIFDRYAGDAWISKHLTIRKELQMGGPDEFRHAMNLTLPAMMRPYFDQVEAQLV